MRLGLGLSLPSPAGVGGVVAPPFSPLDLSPVLWLDASDTSTITESGGAVSQWDDKSGNSYHVTQATAANQPKSGTQTINGLNVLEFDAANTQTLLNSSIDLFSVAYTSFAVVQINASDLFWAFRASINKNGAMGYCQSGSTSTSLAVNTAFPFPTYHANGVLFTGTQRTQLYSHVGTGSPVIARANDGTQTTYNGFSVGVQGDAGQFGEGSLVAEYILVPSSGLTADQITATEEYLGIKWGIYSVPDQITDLTAYPDNQSVDLSWSAPADNGLAISDYLVQYSTDGTNWTTVETSSTSLTVTGLSNGVEYDFRVAAKNAAGVGVVSSVVSSTPSSFSPLNLSPVLWLDASDTSTITESGGAVSQWDDKSGNANHVTQATAASQPTTGTRTLNGLNVLDFDSGDSIENATVSASGQFAVFFVGEDDAISGVARYHLRGLTASSPVVGIASGTSYRLYQGTVVDQGSAATGVKLWRAIFDTTDTLHVNGTAQVSGNAGTTGMTGLRIGSSSGATYAIFGAIAEVILVDGTLTAGEIADTETYLADKWGITI